MEKVSNFIIGNNAFVLLDDMITLERSKRITSQIYDFAEKGYHVTLKINSEGGEVLAGWNIADALITTNSDTHIIGLAASMAGVVAQFGNKRYINDNGIGHAHPPQGGGSEVKEMVRKSLKTALLSRSNLSEDQVTAFFKEGGGNNFFDADEMKAKGLVDEIIVTNQPVISIENKDKSEVFQFFNKLITNNSMDLEIKNELDSSKKEVGKLTNKLEMLEGVNETLTNSLKEHTDSVKALEDENEVLKNKLAEANKSKAVVLIENAIEKGSVSRDKKDDMIEKATNNYDLVSELLNDIKSADFVVENSFSDKEAKPFNKMSGEEKAELARTSPEMYNKLIMK